MWHHQAPLRDMQFIFEHWLTAGPCIPALPMAPICAFFTEQGFRLASNALQVFGGYGYVAEFAIEQTLRDNRIAMIYEGSNEIQANDLLLRKVLGDACCAS